MWVIVNHHKYRLHTLCDRLRGVLPWGIGGEYFFPSETAGRSQRPQIQRATHVHDARGHEHLHNDGEGVLPRRRDGQLSQDLSPVLVERL